MEQLEALICGSRRVSGRQLHERVARAAAGLSGLGICAGDRVGILMRNDLPQIEATLAAQWLGAYPVQINWHAHADEVGYVLRDCGADILVAHSDLLHRCAGHLPDGIQVIGVRPPPELAKAFRLADADCTLGDAVLEWEGWLSRQVEAPPAPAPAVDSIIYTSGTTGRPKGVRRFAATAQQIEMTERMRRTVFGIGPGSRVLVPAPLYHTAPTLFALRAVRQAALLVLPTRFEPEGLLADIERFGITHLYVVPTIFVRLLALPEETRSRYNLGSLQFALHAGGPCAPSVKKRMLDWWGPIIHEYYGSTETGPITFVRGEEWLERPGTVGRAVEGVQIEVRDEAGRALGPGQIGELFVRNDGYADFTYLNQHEARAALERDGLIMSGDLGYRDDSGSYFLCDRKRDLVISGGVNIYPAEIEAVLLAMPGVADCAVFGIPDEEFGEALAAIVQPQPGHAIGPDDVKKFLASSIAGFKQPRLIEVRADLPREESGKIRKRLLREPFWQGAGRSI